MFGKSDFGALGGSMMVKLGYDIKIASTAKPTQRIPGRSRRCPVTTNRQVEEEKAVHHLPKHAR